MPNKIISYFSICAMVCLFLQTSVCAQDASYVKRKLNIEFSFYTMGSLCEIEPDLQESLASANMAYNTGNMLRFIFPFKNNHSLIGGLNYFRNSLSFNYTLDKNTYHLPFSLDGPLNYKIHALSLPLSYSYALQLSSHIYLFSELGYYITYPLSFGSVESSVSDPQRNSDLIVIHYESAKLVSGVIAAIGLRRPLKRNEVNVNIFTNIPVKKQEMGQYTFFPNQAEFTSSGKIKSGFGYIGCKISYVLTHKKTNE
ncbi:MAG: hypothetical protein JEZ09_20145 [Salinivirgaceae bacterium]|nr:hypothetical protein [Salinivirgaceae bacterium]